MVSGDVSGKEQYLLYNFYNDKRHSGGRFYLRRRLLESSSFIVDDPVFYEYYYGLGNEFWPGDDGRPVEQYLGAVGARYRQNTQFPYWDPVQGEIFEIAAEYDNALLGSKLDYVRVVGQYGLVRMVPESWGILPNSRFALRAYGGWSWPDSASLFRLGGGQRLRALDLTSQEGSSVWLMTAEWRFPIWREINQDVLDHILSFRHLYGAAFYDVGQSYLKGHWGPVVHGPGFGFRWDVLLFSFSSAPPSVATSPSRSASAADRLSGSGSTRCSELDSVLEMAFNLPSPQSGQVHSLGCGFSTAGNWSRVMSAACRLPKRAR